MKTTRRRFIQSATTATAVPFASSGTLARISMRQSPQEKAATQVPDTLDLVQNGIDALNGLAGTLVLT
jgi:hypothetical protein